MRGRGTGPARLRQRGVAVITALLLTTLAVTIVASLFWQQQVQVRSMENQRLHQQTKWILLGAIDLARFWLRQDVDPFTRLDGIWAKPIEETSLDQFVERERVEGETFAATLSGQVTDAQGRFNLTNLAKDRVVDESQLKAFRRLLVNLQLDPALAQPVADAILATQRAALENDKTAAPAQASSGAEPMDFSQVEDVLSVPGWTPPMLERLREFVIVLPESSTLNINTAPAEVLAAAVDFSVAEAAALVANRLRKPFSTTADFDNAVQGRDRVLDPNKQVGMKSNYFLVASRIRLDRAALDTQALLWRQDRNKTMTLVWIREN